MKYNSDGILYLRNAIVEDAAKEYLSLKKSIAKLEKLKNPRKWKLNELETKRSRLEYLKKWFRSEDFDCLGLKLSGKWYLEQLDAIDVSTQIHHQRIQEKKGGYYE